MGMAATQARFLSLTARKSNVEFQGQQINQQRTTLSNESASYYSELCNMTVPTPPSVDNYTKTSYTFNDGAMTNTITTMLVNPDRNEAGETPYLISYVQEWEDDYSPVEAASSFINKAANGYFIGNSQLRLLGEMATKAVVASKFNGYDVNQDEDGTYYINEPDKTKSYEPCTQEDIDNFEYYLYDENTKGVQKLTRDGDKFYNADNEEVTDLENLVICLYNEDETDAEYAAQLVAASENEAGETVYTKEVYTDTTKRHDLTAEELASITTNSDLNADEIAREEGYRYLLNEKYNSNDQNGQWYVRYVKDSTTGTEKPYFYKASNLEALDFSSGYATTNCYTIGSTTKTKEVINAPGTVERDSSGRYISVTLFEKDANGNVDKNSAITYNLTVNTTTDEAAYNDALNEYNYQQAQYDKKIQDINSKLEIVQQQDKSLELNLKQLDTEEQAINTEMEAVSKVISKNVSDTFGTFKATG